MTAFKRPELEKDVIRCPGCGALLDRETETCPHCGSQLEWPEEGGERRPRIIAGSESAQGPATGEGKGVP